MTTKVVILFHIAKHNDKSISPQPDISPIFCSYRAKPQPLDTSIL